MNSFLFPFGLQMEMTLTTSIRQQHYDILMVSLPFEKASSTDRLNKKLCDEQSELDAIWIFFISILVSIKTIMAKLSQ